MVHLHNSAMIGGELMKLCSFLVAFHFFPVSFVAFDFCFVHRYAVLLVPRST